VAKGVVSTVVDYASPSSLQTALKGIDVVISTLGGQGPSMAAQQSLADAAKAAEVKLFIPSEFGGDTRGETDGPLAVKNAQRERLEQIGLPWTVFFTGPFADWILYQPIIGFDVKNGKAQVVGTGDRLVSFTSRRDIARYLVHVVLVLSPSELHNHVFKVQGERTSVNRVLEAYQVRTGRRVEVQYITLEEVEKAANAGDLTATLQLVFEAYSSYGDESEMNVEWPEFHPQTVIDAMLSSG